MTFNNARFARSDDQLNQVAGRRTRAAVLVLLVAAMVPLLAGAAAPARPNILWITAENMGPDLGCYPDSPWAKQVRTTNVDQLASEGLRYRLAFDTSPGCSPSRSSFMTGMYATAIGAHNHRSHRHDHFYLPKGVRPITHRLADAGYFTANIISMGEKRVGTGKTDLNFEVVGPVLNSKLARTLKPSANDAGIDEGGQNDYNTVRLYHSSEWSDLKAHQPFFAQVNLPVVERTRRGPTYGWTGSAATPAFGSQVHPSRTDSATVTVPPYYPDHPITGRDWASYLDAVNDMDVRVGEILTRLAADGLSDNTIVVFFADNGRLEARGHHWCYDSGERVPLVVRWPAKFPSPEEYQVETVSDRLVSLIDLTATTLAFADVEKPAGMQSEIILGRGRSAPRRYAFSSRDRCNEVPQRIRSVRSARYRYNRNFMPENSFSSLNRYKEASYPVMPLMRQLQAEGKLTPVQAALMAPRLPDEELYDLESDPHEIRNLAASANPSHQRVRQELSAAVEQWIEATGDQGRTLEPASELIEWIKVNHDRFGTPAWAIAKGAYAGESRVSAALTLAAVLRDEATFAGAHDIEIRDGLAYVAGKGFTARAVPSNGNYPYEKGKGGSLAIVDVKQPTSPRVLWHSTTPLAYEDAETVLPLHGNRLLIGAREVLLFDVAQPTQPIILARFHDRPRADVINGFARIGDVVFGASKTGWVFAADVSTPDKLELLGARHVRESDGLGSPHDAAAGREMLIIISPEGFGDKGRPGKMGVYQVFDPKTRRVLPPSRWTLLGKLTHPRLAGANRVRTRGNFAYVGSSLGGSGGGSQRSDGLRANVSVIDLSDPTTPKLIGTHEFTDPASGSNGLEIAGDVVFAAGGQTVHAIDVTNPAAPRELARFYSAEAFSGGRDDGHDLVLHNGHLFVTAQNTHALVVLKVSDDLLRRTR